MSPSSNDGGRRRRRRRRNCQHGRFPVPRVDSFDEDEEDEEAELVVVFDLLGDASIDGGELGHGGGSTAARARC